MTSFAYTGAVQTWTATTGGNVQVTLNGAGDGNAHGGQTVMTFAANPGDVLNIYVGGQGQPATVAGWNGGGTGAQGWDGSTSAYSAARGGNGGGGATDVRLNGTALANRIAVAGGSGGTLSGQVGGAGGGTQGVGGTGNGGGYTGGGGGTQSSGGAAGSYGGPGFAPSSGSLGQGGSGGATNSGGTTTRLGGAGGGGGYYGGGGSGADGTQWYDSGGGGSGYVAPTVNGSATTGATTTGAGGTGNGSATVVLLSSAPAAPTLTSPVAGAYLDATQPVQLAAAYNSTDGQNQNAYALRAKTSGAPAYSYWNAGSGTLQSTIVWNPIVTAPSASFTVTLPSNALANGNTYNWSAASQESSASMQGPFAPDATFNTQAGPVATLTTPTGSVVTAQAVAEWTTTPATGAAQTNYRLVLYTAAQAAISGFTPGTSPSAWDSGTVASAAQQAEIGYTFTNGISYVLYLQVTQTGGQTSTWVSSSFTATFDTPATPTITSVYATDPTTGLPHLSVTVQGHDNLLTADDASFETSVGTWVAGTNWTVAQDTAHALDGSASLKCLRQNSTAGSGYASTAQYTVQPATLYTAMVQVYADSTSAGKQYELIVNESPSGHRTTATVTLGAAGTWTPVTVAFTTQADTASAHLTVADDPQTAPAAAQAIWLDRAGVFPGTPGQWFRGGLAGSVQVIITRDDGLYVRGASQANPVTLPASTQTVALPDAEVIPTEEHTYTAVGLVVLSSTSSIVSAQAGPTALVAVPGALGFWEFDPTDLTTAVAAQISAYNPQITEQATAHMVLGQATPNVIASVMGGVDGEATFETFDTPTYKALTGLLLSQRTVFISDPFGDNQGVTYVRFGPQTGGMSGGTGLKAKSANLLASSASAPRHTIGITWTAQPRPAV